MEEVMNENKSNSCLICSNSDNLVSTDDKDKNNIEWREKLYYCLPELDWSIIFKLCLKCSQELDNVCLFRNQCFNSYIKNLSSINCKLCNETFDTSSDLIKHNKQVHLLLETNFQCSLCKDKLNTITDLIHHEKLHFHTCGECGVSFKNRNDLENHETLRHVANKQWGHVCLECTLKFPNEEALKAHVKIEHLETFNCFHCNQNYNDKIVLAEHISNEHKHNKNVCVVCKLDFTTIKKLEIHKTNCKKIGKKRGRKPKPKIDHKCDQCEVSFSTNYLLKRHTINVHATEKKHNCDICGQKFASPVYLNAHKKYHSGDRPHICSFCGKGFITASDLYHHEKIHRNKRAYKCEKCSKAFNTSSDLHKHRICVHMDRSLWKYVCCYCERRFPLKTNLDTHTKTHTGEKNFQCHLCVRKCISHSVLQRHIKSHSNVRTFRCNQCSQDYKYQKSLNIHMAKAHGIGDAKIPVRVKKYFCHICPKSYFANNRLQKHIRSHTGERPFQCPVCEKPFIDKSYIKQHLKVAHDITLLPTDVNV